MTRMDCSELRDLLAAYHDDELSTDERRTVTDHLNHCVDCRRDLARMTSLSARVVAAGTYATPPHLLQRIADRLGIEDRLAAARKRRLGLFASHAAAAVLGALLLHGATGRFGQAENVVRDALAAHSRSMMSDRLVQVASADTHTVRPWLATQVPFSPPVRNALPGDYPLLGGRADVLLSRPAAVMVYGRRNHRINVFAQPTDATDLPTKLDTSRNGYNVVVWRDGDFSYLAISDLNPKELTEFTTQLRNTPR